MSANDPLNLDTTIIFVHRDAALPGGYSSPAASPAPRRCPGSCWRPNDRSGCSPTCALRTRGPAPSGPTPG